MPVESCDSRLQFHCLDMHVDWHFRLRISGFKDLETHDDHLNMATENTIIIYSKWKYGGISPFLSCTCSCMKFVLCGKNCIVIVMQLLQAKTTPPTEIYLMMTSWRMPKTIWYWAVYLAIIMDFQQIKFRKYFYVIIKTLTLMICNEKSILQKQSLIKWLTD